MDKSVAGDTPQRTHDVLLVASNIGLIVFAVGFMVIASGFYRGKSAAISLNESRFVTTEWSLLQEMKVATDGRLMDKEREILALRKRYLQLVQNPDSATTLAELESQLRKAEDERRDILSLRLQAPLIAAPAAAETPAAAPGSPAPAQAAPAQAAPAASYTSPSLASAVFQSTIATLESQLVEQKALSAALSSALTSSNRERDLAARAYKSELARRDADLEVLSASLSRLREAGRTAIEAADGDARAIELQRQALELDLNTKALLRAIASSPEIRARYPDLLASLDRYFEQSGLAERLRGRSEAYAAARKAMEAMAKELGRR